MESNIHQPIALPVITIGDELIVSSPDNGGLSYIAGDQVTVIDWHATTGLFVDESQLIWGYQENGGRHVNVIKAGKYSQVELSKSALDIHDILIHDQHLYIVTTDNNSVIQLDDTFNIADSWQLPGEHDSAHINSVAYYGGHLIASIFGHFEKHRGYKGDTLGKGQVIDLVSGKTCIDGLSQPHSLTVVDNQLYLCSSEDMALHIYDGYKLDRKISLPGYARGICVGKDHIYVGISISRNIDPDKRGGHKGSIVVIEKQSLLPVGMVQIPFREIYDIRLVHNYRNFMAVVKQSQVNVDTRISELLKTLDLRNESVEQLQAGIKNYEAGIKEYQAANVQLQASIKKYQAANVQLQAEYQAVLLSRSWRVTKPLRYIEQLSKPDDEKS